MRRASVLAAAMTIAATASADPLPEIGSTSLPTGLFEPFQRQDEACRAGDPKACLAAAQILDQTVSVPDADRQAFYAAACDGGAVTGCVRAGELGLRSPAEADRRRARALLEVGCKAREPHACGALARELILSRDGPNDWEQALPLYRMACARGLARVCHAAGGLAERGEDVPRDRRLAVVFHARACRGGEPHGCYRAGSILRVIAASPRARARALSMLRTSCRAYRWEACVEAGALLRGDHGSLPPGIASAAVGRALIRRGTQLEKRMRRDAEEARDRRNRRRRCGGPDPPRSGPLWE
jgi:hypothetical protein